MWLWLESRALRARGDHDAADGREALAADGGLALARQSQRESEVQEALRIVDEGDLQRGIRRLFALAGTDARFGLAVAQYRGRLAAQARATLTPLVAEEPNHAQAWNLLGVVQRQLGLEQAAVSFESALAADPFLPEALANAGLEALERGDESAARRYLTRLAAMSVGDPWEEERALERAIGER
jgi:predicted Zn-dependent protease